MKPKEDPADKAARLRERRMTEIERTSATENNAGGLTSDLRAVYGMKGMGSMSGGGTTGMPGTGGGGGNSGGNGGGNRRRVGY